MRWRKSSARSATSIAWRRRLRWFTGTLETPDFQRQSRDFAAAVKAAGKPVTLAVMEGYNHFEVMEQLGNPYSLFGRAALEQMRLAAR